MIFVAILAVSTASIFIKLCDAPALVISAYRVVVASLVLALLQSVGSSGGAWAAAKYPGLSFRASSSAFTLPSGLPP